MKNILCFLMLWLSVHFSFAQLSYEGTYKFDDSEPAEYNGDEIVHPDYTVHYTLTVFEGGTGEAELSMQSFSLDDRLGTVKCRADWDLMTDVMQIVFISATNEEGKDNQLVWAKEGIKKGTVLFEIEGPFEKCKTTWKAIKPTKNLDKKPLEHNVFFVKEL